jgi:hypothetical protein
MGKWAFIIEPLLRGLESLDKKQKYFVLIDGTNNVLETVRCADGVVVGSYGRPGRGFTGCVSASLIRAATSTPAKSIPGNACRNGYR